MQAGQETSLSLSISGFKSSLDSGLSLDQAREFKSSEVKERQKTV